MVTRRNQVYLVSMVVLSITILFASGILTALLIPQMMALWQWMGFAVEEPDLWDIYILWVSMLLMPVILVLFAVVLRQPKGT